MNPGRIILQNLLREGFDAARITVVKPGLEELDGCRCVPRLADLAEPVDALVLAVAAPQAAEMLAECAEIRKAESVVVISGGLEERPGAEALVARMREALLRSRATPWRGPVVNGGNCLGVRSRPGRFNTLFIPEHKLPFPAIPPSPVALVTGSGAFAVSKVSKLAGVNPLYVITIGNQMDLTAADYLEHLAKDDRVEVFAVYVEGFQPLDGGRFMEIAAGIVRSGRTVILARGGRTEAGAAAAASHTAAVAGDDAILTHLAADAGVVVAESLEDFEDLVRLFTLLGRREPTGRRLGAISNAGYESVAIADGLGRFELAHWHGETVARLCATLAHARLDGVVTVRNPLDVTPILGDADYEAVVRHILEDEGVDLAVVGCVPLTGALDTLAPGSGHGEDLRRAEALTPRLLRVWRETPKPWVAVVDAGPLFDPMARMLEDGGVPTFRTADRALRLFGIWCESRLRAVKRAERTVHDPTMVSV
jgi:acyl-CoA synthetase (NDP forming)